jgi:ribonuclease HII
MPFLIGTDEAGYGPNYGPLCVSATVWEVDDGIDAACLYKKLRRSVTDCVDRAAKRKIVWADSKAVYKSGGGMDHLERGVLAALSLIDRRPAHWHELWSNVQHSPSAYTAADAGRAAPSEIAASNPRDSLATNHHSGTITLTAEPSGAFAELPWHLDFAATLPIWLGVADGPAWMSIEALPELGDCIRESLAAAGVRLVAILCRALFPAEFNDLVAASNKADVLSRATLGLVADALELISGGSVEVSCDKHGGRDYYLPLLQSHFEDWIEVRRESSAASQYRCSSDERTVDIGFYVGGERFLPVALASMTAKYVRETAMRPFNEFWCARVDGLKPTAGYPVDAHRYRKQIAAVQRELEIDERIIWRGR